MTICPDASVTISGFSRMKATSTPLTSPTSTPTPTHASDPERQPVVRAGADADEDVPAERDDAGGRKVDAALA